MGVVVGWSFLWDGNGEGGKSFWGREVGWDGMRCGEFDIGGAVAGLEEIYYTRN